MFVCLFVCVCDELFWHNGYGEFKPPGYGPDFLVYVSICQGFILGYLCFTPHPYPRKEHGSRQVCAWLAPEGSALAATAACRMATPLQPA